MKHRKRTLQMIVSGTARCDHAGNTLAGAAATLKRLCRAYLAWRTESAMAGLLQSMSDRELSDIGLSRSDIGGAVARMWAPRDTGPQNTETDELIGDFAPAGYAPSH
jgi:uncharacterized protein YjiS (DUF1127 family)